MTGCGRLCWPALVVERRDGIAAEAIRDNGQSSSCGIGA
jgi:hypothetical protein